MKFKKSAWVTLGAFLCFSAVSPADLILEYNAGDNTNGVSEGGITQSADPSFQADHISGSSFGVAAAQTLEFVQNTGLTNPDSPDNAFNSTNWTVGSGNGTYFTFTVDILDGYSLQMTNVSLVERAFLTSPDNFFVRYSADSYASPILEGTTSSGWDQNTFDVSTNTLLLTGTVAFRIIGENADNASANWNIDHVQIWGTMIAPIPEPASMSLLAVGGLLSIYHYRRRRNKL